MRLAAPLAVAVLVRLATWWLIGATGDWPTQGDASSYVRASENLVEAGTYSYDPVPSRAATAYRPPGYSVFLAGLRAVWASVWLVRLAQLALSLLTLLLLARAAEALEPATGVWAAWLTALSPFDAVYTGVVLSETLTTFLLVGAFAALVVAPARVRLAAGGAALGLACLVRDQYLALVPFLGGLWFLLGRAPWRERGRQAMVVAAVAALVVLPWTVRNYVHFQKLIPVSAGRLGLSLWMGSWALDGEFTKSDTTGTRVYPDEAFLRADDRALLASTTELEQDALFRRWFGERLRVEPVAVVGRWLRRAPLLWLGTRFDIFELRRDLFPRGSAPWRLVKVALYGLNLLLLVAGVVGLALAVRRRAAVLWLAAPLAFTALLFLPLNSFENRYSQPMLPFLVVLAGVAGQAVVEWRARQVGARSRTGGAVPGGSP